jgi:hypothetical protein
MTGRATGVNGRAAKIGLHGTGNVTNIKAVYTIGKEEPTSAEEQRALLVLKALYQIVTLLQNPFISAIWKPLNRPAAVTAVVGSAVPFYFPSRPLNPSQRRAVERALDPSEMITMIQGPPGSGKTTVIAAAVMSLMALKDRSKTVWLVAQSNVAVKNIAEKLAECDFLDFKLLVSKDFHFDWFVFAIVDCIDPRTDCPHLGTSICTTRLSETLSVRIS